MKNVKKSKTTNGHAAGSVREGAASLTPNVKRRKKKKGAAAASVLADGGGGGGGSDATVAAAAADAGIRAQTALHGSKGLHGPLESQYTFMHQVSVFFRQRIAK